MGGEFNWAEFTRVCRDKRKLKQKQFGFLLGVERETVSRWETGREVPGIRAQEKLRGLMLTWQESDSFFKSLIYMVDATDGLATLLDRDFRVARTSPKHQKLSTYDLTSLYGTSSERFWSEEMSGVMRQLGGMKGYRSNGVHRLRLKLEVIRKPGEPGYGGNERLFTVGTTVTVGTPLEPIGFHTQLVLETGGDPTPPEVVTFAGETFFLS